MLDRSSASSATKDNHLDVQPQDQNMTAAPAENEGLLSFQTEGSKKKVSSTFTAETAQSGVSKRQRPQSKSARSFAESHRHGVVDSDDEDDKDILDMAEQAGATPMTKRRIMK